MNKKSIINYLQRLSLVAKESLRKEYNISMIDFNALEYINTFLIHKVVEDGINLHIRTCEKDENDRLYIPAIIAIVISGFVKNFVAYNPLPQVGDILQKDKERWTIISTNSLKEKGRPIIISNKANASVKYLSIDKYKTFFIPNVTKETDRKLKIGFDHYKKFFNTIINGGVGEAMPSKFQYKYLIITSKEIYKVLRKVDVADVNFFKSLPIRYVTSRGKITDNIPIDPMVYIANDYETAKEYIIEEHIIDTLVVIGDSKYRECIRHISQDIRASRVNNVIFIGNEKIGDFENLRRWNWTKPELCFILDRPCFEPEVRVLKDTYISSKITAFQKEVEQVENKYNVTILKYFTDIIRQISRIIIPKSDSRLTNKLIIIKEDFKRIIAETVEEILYDKEVLNYEKDLNNLIVIFNQIVDSVSTQKWAYYSNLKSSPYAVVPKDHYDDILTGATLSNNKLLLYTQLAKLKIRNPKMCFFSLYGMSHFNDCYLSTSFQPMFILYPHEGYYFKMLKAKYETDIENELISSDRFLLSGVKYSIDETSESIDEMMLRLFGVTDEDPQEELHRQCRGESSHIVCRIEFEDGGYLDVDSSKSVLLNEHNSQSIVTADKLRIGDNVRIYENLNKEKLWEIALENDNQGVFSAIEEASVLWKTYLNEYKTNLSIDTETLYNRLCANGLIGIKNYSTIDRWLDIDSNTKFPAGKRSMKAIAKTIDNQDFNNHYTDIMAKRRAYRGIMISLGRDLSDDIAAYIQSDGKIIGQTLSKLENSVRKGIADSNAPLRIIKKITYNQDETE